MHNGQGNVGLADGSVQQVSIPGLQQMLKNTGDSTNRVALPE
jgi:prepilin-type processing-associated H-X9-DG protein